jgi:DNA-binding GntR family transcriptional regulator
VDGKVRIDVDNEFHDIIYTCSGELLAKDIINTQITHYNRIRYLIELNEKVKSKTVLEHRALIQAAEKKNTKEFKALLKKHIRRILQEQEKLKELFPDYIE